MTSNDPDQTDPTEEEPRDDEDTTSLELNDETLSDLSTDEDVVGGFSGNSCAITT